MEVRDIMTTEVAFCRPETNLATAAAAMWQHDCGVLPVVDENMHLTGMITDRDICIALATRNQLASDMTAGEVSAGRAFACNPDDNIQSLLATMRSHKVRRVPVVDGDGTIAGIVSIDDIILLAKEKKGSHRPPITYADAIETQKAIAARPFAISMEKDLELQATPGEPVAVHTEGFDFEE